MQKSWWNKQYGIIIAAIVLLMITALLYKDSLLDTEKVHEDERLYNVGVLIDSTITMQAGTSLIMRDLRRLLRSWG